MISPADDEFLADCLPDSARAATAGPGVLDGLETLDHALGERSARPTSRRKPFRTMLLAHGPVRESIFRQGSCPRGGRGEPLFGCGEQPPGAAPGGGAPPPRD